MCKRKDRYSCKYSSARQCKNVCHNRSTPPPAYTLHSAPSSWASTTISTSERAQWSYNWIIYIKKQIDGAVIRRYWVPSFIPCPPPHHRFCVCVCWFLTEEETHKISFSLFSGLDAKIIKRAFTWRSWWTTGTKSINRYLHNTSVSFVASLTLPVF